MPAKTRQCNCTGTPASEFQDRTYGKFQRIHNECKGGAQYKCTCCGNTKK